MTKMKLAFSNTLLSAFLAQIVRSFQAHHAKRYLGRTAMQKLAYFCKAVGAPIPCSFEIYNYGPYSDEITFSVDAMMADEVLKDISKHTKKYSNYRLSSNANDISDELQDKVEDFETRIDNVVEVLGGFDPPTLELIATLHFVADRLVRISGAKPSQDEVVKGFQDIKGSKFTEKDVNLWYGKLVKARLV